MFLCSLLLLVSSLSLEFCCEVVNSIMWCSFGLKLVVLPAGYSKGLLDTKSHRLIILYKLI